MPESYPAIFQHTWKKAKCYNLPVPCLEAKNLKAWLEEQVKHKINLTDYECND